MSHKMQQTCFCDFRSIGVLSQICQATLGRKHLRTVIITTVVVVIVIIVDVVIIAIIIIIIMNRIWINFTYFLKITILRIMVILSLFHDDGYLMVVFTHHFFSLI